MVIVFSKISQSLFTDDRRGSVTSDSKNDPAKGTKMFIAQIVIMDHPVTDAGTVGLASSKPLRIETFAECSPLGRFAIRDMMQTVPLA
ncbi:unnamed protein product [Acanthocheilonema viteae]|uniref:GTP-eEF1A C-terminal domain-containing protein n=1 Tax=Acanthocheilonema viteae TaxID=6277 RepID=A0A498SJD3_ACAVI|nr:unnamed protein product [Acanthocheilonema viteae]